MAPAQIFPRKIHEIVKNAYLEEHLRTTASERSYWQILTVFLCYSIKDYIFLIVLLVEGFV